MYSLMILIILFFFLPERGPRKSDNRNYVRLSKHKYLIFRMELMSFANHIYAIIISPPIRNFRDK